MIRIKCTMDASQVRAGLVALGKEAPRASMRAINRTLQTANTLAVRAIAKDLGIAQREIRGYGDQTRGHRSALRISKATTSSLRGALEGTGKRLALYDFAARQTKRGVSYRMQGQRRVIPSGFIAQMRSGHKGVFVRTGKKRLPIVERFGPSVPYVFRKHIKAGLREAVEQAMQKHLQHEVAYLLTFGRR